MISSQTSGLPRRRLIFGAAAMTCAAASGLSVAFAQAKGPPRAITTYRSAGCGCCGKWEEAARAAGYRVNSVMVDDIMATKKKLGVPDRLAACHTSVVGPYVVEGHVPLDAIATLLRLQPRIRGIAVPGMPIGSPGMEVPSGEKQDFQVLAFDREGNVRRFA